MSDRIKADQVAPAHPAGIPHHLPRDYALGVPPMYGGLAAAFPGAGHLFGGYARPDDREMLRNLLLDRHGHHQAAPVGHAPLINALERANEDLRRHLGPHLHRHGLDGVVDPVPRDAFAAEVAALRRLRAGLQPPRGPAAAIPEGQPVQRRHQENRARREQEQQRERLAKVIETRGQRLQGQEAGRPTMQGMLRGIRDRMAEDPVPNRRVGMDPPAYEPWPLHDDDVVGQGVHDYMQPAIPIGMNNPFGLYNEAYRGEEGDGLDGIFAFGGRRGAMPGGWE